MVKSDVGTKSELAAAGFEPATKGFLNPWFAPMGVKPLPLHS